MVQVPEVVVRGFVGEILKAVGCGVLLIVGLFVVACAPAASPSPGAAPAKPADAAKPAAGSPTPASPATSASPGAGPAASPSPAAAAATTDKADLDAAKREGAVTWYTSTPLRQAQNVANAFEQKYGFKVEVFRTGGEQVIQRFTTEASAGRTVADLLTASDPAAFNQMVQKNQLVRFRPANFEKVPQTARNEEGFWVAQRLNLVTMAFRSDKENEADMPRSWADAGNPKYQGKLVHADPAFTALALQIVATFSRDKGWDYYEALKKNDMMIVQGHQQLAQMLSTGERTIAAEAGDSDMWDLRRKGIAVKSVYPEDGVFVIAAPTGVVAGSPHPNAAKLLAEFMLSDEAQKLFPEEGFYAARSDMPPPEGNPQLSSLKLIGVDLNYVEQNTDRLKQRFGEIFSN